MTIMRVLYKDRKGTISGSLKEDVKIRRIHPLFAAEFAHEGVESLTTNIEDDSVTIQFTKRWPDLVLQGPKINDNRLCKEAGLWHTKERR